MQCMAKNAFACVGARIINSAGGEEMGEEVRESSVNYSNY